MLSVNTYFPRANGPNVWTILNNRPKYTYNNYLLYYTSIYSVVSQITIKFNNYT